MSPAAAGVRDSNGLSPPNSVVGMADRVIEEMPDADEDEDLNRQPVAQREEGPQEPELSAAEAR